MTGASAIQLVIALTIAAASVPRAAADLRSYVNADDRAYGWEHIAQTNHPDGAVVHDLRFTSQVWQGIPWRHRLQIAAPLAMPEPPALILLLIAGTGAAERERRDGISMAQALRAPVAILYDVPNQPLFGGLVEDDLLAHTFVRFLETQDATWPLLLPMVKSVVRAMDALQAFTQREWHARVSGFVVSGASKRGWTAWLTPVVDERVKAIAPQVYDNLNLAQQLRHQRQTWGEVSREIADYTARGLPQRLLAGEKAAVELAMMVDPFSYRQHLTVPKLIILGTNDRYWPLDALNLYYDALLGEKYTLYIANAGHNLRPGRGHVLSGLMALFQKSAGRLQLPTLRGEAKAEGRDLTLTVTSDRTPQAVRAWVASAPTRDFREARWEAFAMHRERHGYVYRHTQTSGRVTAIFGEAEFAADTGPYVLSTTVSLFP
jgi:PhoPQ-activated pathogenicity-related protein